MNRALLVVLVVALTVQWAGTSHAERVRRPIDTAELRLALGILKATDDQRIIAAEMHKEYLALRDRGNVSELITKYSDRERQAIDAVAHGEGDPGERAARLYGELDRELTELNAILDAADEEFLRQVEALLTPEQLPLMKRVRGVRERRILRSHNPAMPGAGVDIIAISYARLDQSESAAEFHRYLDEFEDIYLVALRHVRSTEYGVAPDRYRMRSIEWTLQHDAVSDDERSRLVAEQQRLKTRSLARVIAAAKEVVRLNRQAIDDLKDRLPEAEHGAIRRTYLSSAYPDVYPDPADASRWFDAALSLADLEDYQREAIIGARGNYEQRHDALSLAMTRQEDKVWELRATVTPHDRFKVTIEHNRFVELGRQREKLFDETWHFLASVLYPDQVEQLPPRPEQFPRRWDPDSSSDVRDLP